MGLRESMIFPFSRVRRLKAKFFITSIVKNRYVFYIPEDYALIDFG